MNKTKRPIRLKLTSHMCDNISYIVIDNGKVSHFGPTEINLAIANVAGANAAELRFALEDVKSAVDAMHITMKLAQCKKVEIL